MNYASASNIREVIKFYNVGDKTFETDFSVIHFKPEKYNKYKSDRIVVKSGTHVLQPAWKLNLDLLHCQPASQPSDQRNVEIISCISSRCI